MMKLAILADDFTGSLDTAVQFSSRGISTMLLSEGAPLEDLPEQCEVLTINMQTRHLTGVETYRKVFDTASRLRALGAQYLYVKTDSGMRGNIGAALAAAAESWSCSVFFAPAYPQTGRTVENGVLFVEGTPVSQSMFADDLFNPVRHDRIADIIAEETSMPVTGEWREKGVIVLRDAVSSVDLKRVAAEIAATPNARVIAGCAGLAHELPETLGIASHTISETRLPQPVIVISGSTNQVSIGQLRHCERNGFRSVIFKDVLASKPDFDAVVRQVLTSVSLEGALLEVARSGSDVNMVSRLASQAGLTPAETGQRIATNLGRAAAAIIRAGFEGVLFVFGGDTLAEVVKQLGVTCIHPLYEVESGVVLSEIYSDNVKRYLISKSGSFGKRDVVETVCRRFMREECVQ